MTIEAILHPQCTVAVAVKAASHTGQAFIDLGFGYLRVAVRVEELKATNFERLCQFRPQTGELRKRQVTVAVGLGLGLGLAIARTIARAHGGDVMLENRGGGGLRAALSLPVEG